MFLENEVLEEDLSKKSEENFHNSAKEIKEKIEENNNNLLFKQNFHTVDTNLVAQKAVLKNHVESQDTTEVVH
jgi:uncharacterized SAM-binding protein YcdF (DUF218 family)